MFMCMFTLYDIYSSVITQGFKDKSNGETDTEADN